MWPQLDASIPQKVNRIYNEGTEIDVRNFGINGIEPGYPPFVIAMANLQRNPFTSADIPNLKIRGSIVAECLLNVTRHYTPFNVEAGADLFAKKLRPMATATLATQDFRAVMPAPAYYN